MKPEWQTRSAESLPDLPKTERMLIIAIMVIVGVMSGVLSNTGTAAVLIPVVIGIAAKSGYKRSRLTDAAGVCGSHGRKSFSDRSTRKYDRPECSSKR